MTLKCILTAPGGNRALSRLRLQDGTTDRLAKRGQAFAVLLAPDQRLAGDGRGRHGSSSQALGHADLDAA